MGSITEHQPSQSWVQIASSTSATIGLHDSFLPSSDTQASTLLDLCALFRSRLDQFQVMDQRRTAPRVALSSIDKELDSLNRSLMSCRNAYVPISALPPELLARIFRFFALEAPSWVPTFRQLGWIVVTYVCRRWRNVALDDSSLWARISGIPRSTKWLSEILVRAQNTPLVFDHVLISKREILTRHLPGPLISRTRELRLRSPSQFLSEAVQDIWEFEAPELEHFELDISDTYSVTFCQLFGKTLFKGRMPKLRTISLSQVLIPWSLLPRGQLTQLRIMLRSKISTSDPPLPVTLDQLVELLLNSPELEILVLDLCFPTILSQAPHGEQIHLPSLSQLHLGGPTSCITNLLERFIIPSSASLHLHCIPESHPIHADHLIPPLISAAHFRHRDSVEFKSLKVTANSSWDLIEVAAFTSLPNSTIYDHHLAGGDMDSEAELTLSFDGLTKSGPSKQGDILRQVCSILPISNLEFLSISVYKAVQPIDWYEVFLHCKNITTIQARGITTCGFLRSLAPPKPADAPTWSKAKKRKAAREWKRGNGAMQARARMTDDASGSRAAATTATTTPFPKLTCLLLEFPNSNYPILCFRILADILIDALQWRKMNGSPVKALSVVCSMLSASSAKRLKKYVQEFSWDGQ